MDVQVSKPGHAHPGVSKNLPHAQLVAASFDRGGMVVRDSEPSRSVGGGNGGAGGPSEKFLPPPRPKKPPHTRPGALRGFVKHRRGTGDPRVFPVFAEIR